MTIAATGEVRLADPGDFAIPGFSSTAVLGVASATGTHHGRLRLTAGSDETFSDEQGASIDLHGNHASANTGVLDLVAGEAASGTNGAIKFWTNRTGGFGGQQTSALITGEGKMGIGTTTPAETLTVSGTAQITGALKDSSGDAGTAGQILSSTGNGTNWIAAPSGGGSNTDSQTLAFGSSATTTETTLEIADGNVLTLQATGALTFNQTGTNTLQVSAPVVDTTQTIDTDGDTKIQMQKNGVDDDTVRFDANGREALSIKEDRLTLSMKPLFTGGQDDSSVSFTPGYNGANNVQMVFIETNGIGDPNERGLRFSVGNTMPTIDAVIGDANARRHFNFGGEKNVGIGYPVTEPQATLDNFKLNVLGNFMTTENAQIGSSGEELVLGQMGSIADFAGLAHKSHATNTGYALLQQSTGQTLLNAPTGQAISFRINSSEHMRLHSNGHLGIKTGDPLQPLDVNGTALFRNGGNSTIITGNEQILFGWNGTNQYPHAIRTRHNGGSPNNAIDFYTWDSSLAANTDLPTRLGMTINNGQVGIGDGMLNPTETLTVSGTALVTGNFETGGSISQTGTGVLHPDYVFEQYFEGASEVNPAYAMPSLESVEAFVKVNKYLPGVQSRADIEKAGQWNITENVRTNLEKVEELYLHTIEQQKEIETLKNTVRLLVEQLEQLKTQQQQNE